MAAAGTRAMAILALWEKETVDWRREGGFREAEEEGEGQPDPELGFRSGERLVKVGKAGTLVEDAMNAPWRAGLREIGSSNIISATGIFPFPWISSGLGPWVYRTCGGEVVEGSSGGALGLSEAARGGAGAGDGDGDGHGLRGGK